jgi:hypothetical protein
MARRVEALVEPELLVWARRRGGFGTVEHAAAKATEEVRVELQRQDDEVLQFVKGVEDLFVPIDEPIQHEVRAILRDHPRLIHAGRSGADPFVIALATMNDAAVVCEEGRGKRGTPKIPDVCEALGIPFLKLYQLVIEQGWEYG